MPVSNDFLSEQSNPRSGVNRLRRLCQRLVGRTSASQSSEAEMSALFAAMTDVVLVLDGEARYLKIAPTNPSLLYKPADELLGKKMHEIFPSAQADTFLDYIRRALDTRQTINAEYSLDIGGTETWFAAAISPLSEDQVIWVARDITKLKRAEEALAYEQYLLRSLMDNLPDSIYFKDTDSRFIRSNLAQARRYGLSDPAQAIGKSDSDFFTEEHARRAYMDEQEIIKTGQPVMGKEEKLTHTDGRVRWVFTTKMPLRDQAGQIVGTFGISRDITDLKLAEQALAQERNLLRSLIDNVPDYIYVKDTRSRFLTANPALARLIGEATPDELLGKTDFDFFPQELATKYYADEQAIFQTGQPVLELEERTVDTAGNERWVSTTKVPLRDAQGKIFGLVGMGRDITERKQTEAALARERDLLNALLDNIPDYIYLKDTQSRFIRTNRAHAKAFRLSDPAEVVGKTDFDFFTEEHARSAYEDEQRIIRTGQPIVGIVERETWHDRPDTWVSSTKMPLRDEKGNIVGTFGVSRDITQLRQAEEILRESEKRYRRQATHLQMAAEVGRAVTSILDLDQVLARVVDLIRDRFEYYHVGVFLADDTGKVVLHAASGPWGQRSLATDSLSFPIGGKSIIGFVSKTGKPYVAQDVTVDPVFLYEASLGETRSEATLPLSIGGAIIGVLDVQSKEINAFSADAISILATMADQIAVAIQNARLHRIEKDRARELEQAYKTLQENQKQLLAAEKMASLGRLAAGIAHEMNTPLAAVRSSLAQLTELTTEYKDSIEDAEIMPEDHGEIVQEMQQAIRLADGAAARALSFVQGIRTQTRDVPRERQRFNAVPVIQETLMLLGHALQKVGCTAVIESPVSNIELYGAPGRLSQVITNLVMNAIDASVAKGGGPITLRLIPRDKDVVMEVIDVGCGIVPENLPKIFDLLFTTKPFGEGTGLGLTIVQDIVVGEFGGTIEVSSQVGEGTTFTIHFPLPPES